MFHKIILSAAIIALTALSSSAASSWGYSLGRRVHLVDRTVPYYAGNPRPIVPARPAYPYGYFGAQYRPYSTLHYGYYREFYQWSTRAGY
jgi:hypothetical protein